MYRMCDFTKEYTYFIDQKLNICFRHASGKEYIFPTLLKDNIEISIPPEQQEIRDFMEKKTETLPAECVDTFLQLMDVKFSFYLISLIDKAAYDMLFYKDMLIINSDRAQFFNEKMVPVKEIYKLYNIGSKGFDGIYAQLLEDLESYINGKINNNINVNFGMHEYVERFRPVQRSLATEFAEKKPDLIKILSYYGDIVRIKSDYCTNKHIIMTPEEIEEIYSAITMIKEIINSCTAVTVERTA